MTVTENNQNTNLLRSKYLVYTSAGDNAFLHHWLKGDRNFDLWITYYGDKKDRYKEVCDFYNVRKGGKFPNLHYVYQHFKNIMDHYEAIFVIDDDMIISGSKISRLFEIREKYNLWVLQPAFDPRGKISFPITCVKPFSFLRFTNFVETGCPLFRKDKLDNFMKVYDPVHECHGVERWFLYSLGPNLINKVAIVDATSSINPPDKMKGGKREIDVLQDAPTRIKNLRTIKERYNIPIYAEAEFGSIRNSFTIGNFIRSITICITNPLINFKKACGKRVRKIKNRKRI